MGRTRRLAGGALAGLAALCATMCVHSAALAASDTPGASSTTTATVTTTASASQPAPSASTVTQTVITTPSAAPTASLPTTAASPTPSETPAPGNSSDTSDVALVIAIAALVLAVAGLLLFLALRRRRAARSAAARWDAGTAPLLGTARWFCDVIAAEVGDRRSTPAQAHRLWGESKPVVVDLERGLYEANRSAPDAPRGEWARAMAQAVTGLRGAVEADFRARENGFPPDPQLAPMRDRVRGLAAARPGDSPGVTPGAGPI